MSWQCICQSLRIFEPIDQFQTYLLSGTRKYYIHINFMVVLQGREIQISTILVKDVDYLVLLYTSTEAHWSRHLLIQVWTAKQRSLASTEGALWDMLENRGVVRVVGNMEPTKCCRRDPYFLGKLSSKEKDLCINYHELNYSWLSGHSCSAYEKGDRCWRRF